MTVSRATLWNHGSACRGWRCRGRTCDRRTPPPSSSSESASASAAAASPRMPASVCSHTPHRQRGTHEMGGVSRRTCSTGGAQASADAACCHEADCVRGHAQMACLPRHRHRVAGSAVSGQQKSAAPPGWGVLRACAWWTWLGWLRDRVPHQPTISRFAMHHIARRTSSVMMLFLRPPLSNGVTTTIPPNDVVTYTCGARTAVCGG